MTPIKVLAQMQMLYCYYRETQRPCNRRRKKTGQVLFDRFKWDVRYIFDAPCSPTGDAADKLVLAAVFQKHRDASPVFSLLFIYLFYFLNYPHKSNLLLTLDIKYSPVSRLARFCFCRPCRRCRWLGVIFFPGTPPPPLPLKQTRWRPVPVGEAGRSESSAGCRRWCWWGQREGGREGDAPLSMCRIQILYILYNVYKASSNL